MEMKAYYVYKIGLSGKEVELSSHSELNELCSTAQEHAVFSHIVLRSKNKR